MDQVQEWFDPIYLQYHDEMVKFAFYLLRDAELAKDIAHNAFLTMLTKYAALRDHPNLHGWLIKTVRYQIKSELQKSRYSLEVPLLPEHELIALDPPPDFLSTLPPGLNENERQILYLFFEVGLTHEQIAAQLGCTPEACRMRLHRAKRRCFDLLNIKIKNF